MWPSWLFKQDRSGPTDYVVEFDHDDLERAKRSVLWHGEWEKQTGEVMGVMNELDIIHDGMSVLDFGCGVGRVTEALLRRYRLRVHAADRSRVMLKHAAVSLKHLDSVVLSSADDVLNSAARSFDAVLLIEVAQHIPEAELDAVLVKLRRLVTPLGRLFVYGNETLDVDATGALDRTLVRDVVARHLEVLREDRWHLGWRTRNSMVCAP